MHDILRERIMRKLEVLPEAQVYQVLDFIEFLEGRYAAEQARRPDGLQRFAERLEDSMRVRNVAPKVIAGTVGVIGSARKVIQDVTGVGREFLDAALQPPASSKPAPPARTTPERTLLRETNPRPPQPPTNGGEQR
ncbi:MAG: hypothetical protein GX539_06100 [Candidatus Cloacimonetes bacterium]|jgi:hypothetical protein|nr:hypothetical protein [Candidatus Cloacimonadota bacterium]